MAAPVLFLMGEVKKRKPGFVVVSVIVKVWTPGRGMCLVSRFPNNSHSNTLSDASSIDTHTHRQIQTHRTHPPSFSMCRPHLGQGWTLCFPFHFPYSASEACIACHVNIKESEGGEK